MKIIKSVLLIVVFIIISCDKKLKNHSSNNNKIVYQIKNMTNNKLLEIDSTKYYVHYYSDGLNYNFVFKTIDSETCNELVKKSNRFIRINNKLTIPVLFNMDFNLIETKIFDVNGIEEYPTYIEVNRAGNVIKTHLGYDKLIKSGH